MSDTACTQPSTVWSTSWGGGIERRGSFFEAHKVELAFVDGKHHFIMCIGWGHPFVWHRMQGISSCADTPPSKQCSKVLARGSFWLSPVFLPSTTLVGIRLPPTLSSLAKDIPAAMAGRSARTFGSQLSHYADGTIHPVARERGHDILRRTALWNEMSSQPIKPCEDTDAGRGGRHSNSRLPAKADRQRSICLPVGQA